MSERKIEHLTARKTTHTYKCDFRQLHDSCIAEKRKIGHLVEGLVMGRQKGGMRKARRHQQTSLNMQLHPGLQPEGMRPGTGGTAIEIRSSYSLDIIASVPKWYFLP